MTSATPLTRATLEAFPLPPVEDGDKHEHGRLLVVAGTREIPGAALLCATAAMRAGAGKLKIATVASVAPHVAMAMPESRTVGLAEDAGGNFADSAVEPLARLTADVDAVVAGPGMAESAAGAVLASALLAAPAAVILDAGVLRSLPGALAAARKARMLPVLLPHAGEMAALLCCDERKVGADPVGCGRECASTYRAITLVKGATSHVVHPDGRVWTFDGGAPGLGVSGSGDTLAGIVGGLAARGADPLTALLWGVLIHGEAGARLARRVGPVGFLAREIADEVPSLLPA